MLQFESPKVYAGWIEKKQRGTGLIQNESSINDQICLRYDNDLIENRLECLTIVLIQLTISTLQIFDSKVTLNDTIIATGFVTILIN